MRRSHIIAVSALVVALVVAPVLPASASTPVPMVEAPDFTPSGNKWRQWMVNLLSSVMGAATPSGYKAEQIANGFIYDHGAWEQMNARFGIDGIRYDESGNMVGVRRSSIGTGTYTDVTIAGLEEQYKAASVKGKGPVRAPATPFKSAIKVLGGVGAAVSAYELSAMLGGAGTNLVGSWFGFDANGIVCGATGFDNEIQQWVFRSMAGQNCSAFDLAADYDPNADLAGSEPILTLAGGITVTYIGIKRPPNGWGTSSSLAGHCWLVSGISPAYANIVPAGRSVALFTTGGSFHGSMGRSIGNDSCRETPTGPDIPGTRISIGSREDTGVSPLLRIRDDSTGAVLATMAVPPTPDPLRTLDCDVTYTDATTATSTGVPYRESSGAFAPPACPATPEGKTPESVAIVQNTPGEADETLIEENVTDEYTEWWEQYPECRIGACNLDLIRLDPEPAVSCFDLTEGCVNWHTDPDKAAKFLCRYGVHDVDLEECNVYAGLFQPGRVATGSPYSDPSTGAWSGGQNAPRGGTTAMNRPLQNPEDLRSCDFPEFSLDPVSWVLTPVNCALERNFVPRPTVIETHLAGAGEAWESKPPAVIASAVTALAPSASGCSRSATLFGTTFDVVNTCAGPMATLAMWSRWITSAGMVILVLVVLKRQIAGMVGYNQGQG